MELDNKFVKVRVVIEPLPGSFLELKNIPIDCTILIIKSLIVEKLSLGFQKELQCSLLHQGKVLHPNQKLSSLISENEEVQLLFRLLSTPLKSSVSGGLNENNDFHNPVESDLNQNNPTSEKENDLLINSMLEQECVEEEEECVEVVVGCEEIVGCDFPSAMADNRHSEFFHETRATVRYFSRMNPERVYPLVLKFSKDAFDQPFDETTDQITSSKFSLHKDFPVEIEPVIPGCICYPAKQTVFVKGDIQVVFHVVPQVVGKLKGALIEIRQKHVLVKTLHLDMDVVKKTFAMVMGFATFVMPILSIGLKAINLDFDSQKNAGYGDYLKIFKFFFIWLPTWVLFIIFGIVFLIIWLLTRPEEHQDFWTWDKQNPENMLKQVKLAFERNFEDGWQQLENLLVAFPDYSKSHVLYGKLQYEGKNYKEALEGFRKAMNLNDDSPNTYHHGALAASKLGEDMEACEILNNAKKRFGNKKFNASMSYNLGCYLARLGKNNEALTEIENAIQKGFSNYELIATDPDLKSLRTLSKFKIILEKIN